jgi:hypothetical protein
MDFQKMAERLNRVTFGCSRILRDAIRERGETLKERDEIDGWILSKYKQTE